MDIKPIMSTFGFGHRCSNHIVIERNGELWLAMAPVAVGGFLPMGMTSMPGTLRIEPLEDGAPVPYTYSATEALLELETEKGARVSIAVEKDARALIIKGSSAFRLNGVMPASHATTLNTAAGVVINIGANRYLISAGRGKISFDDSYILNQFSSVTPVLNVEPENGGFELYVFDLPADTAAPTGLKSLELCAAENAAEFKAFIEELVDIPESWGDVREKIAYPLWLCHRVLDGVSEVIVENKYGSKNSDSRSSALCSMAFKSPKRALELLLAYPVELPPVAGLAALRLLEDGMLCDSREEIYRVYSALETVARRCINERSVDREGLSYYAYRFESGEARSPEFFKAGEPVLAPDLNAYLVIVSEVIGRLARMEYDDGIAQKWESHSRKLLSKLIAELWDGESFIGMNAYTGELSGPDERLSLVPIILGSRLPLEVIRKLTARIDLSAADSSFGLMLALGLYDAGAKTEAEKIVLTALNSVRRDGISCPFYGASLLAAAHKVL